MTQFWQDLLFEVRLFLKSPVTFVATVLTFALGIGANAAIFSLVKAVLFRPLPGTERAENLVVLGSRTKSGQVIPLSFPLYQDLRDHNQVFSALGASVMTSMSLGSGEHTERVWGELVSGNYFEALGTRTILGRPILPEDNLAPGASPVAVLSYTLWQRRFGGDRHVVGRSISLNGHPFTVVGVAQEKFQGSMVGLSFEIFVPLMMQAQTFVYDAHGDILHQREAYWLITQGRLRPGVGFAGAQAAMNVLGDQLLTAYPDPQIAHRAELLPLWRSPFGAQTFLLPVFSILLVVSLLVLLIACANIAGILLTRTLGRTGELAIRLALGAGRTRLFFQFLIGTLLLTVLGGVAGLACASWTSGLFVNRPGPNGVPLTLNANVDWTVFAFSVALALGCGLITGVAPAVRMSRFSIVSALNNQAGSRVAAGSRLRSALVVGQIAVSLLLLICATLLVRSFQKTQAINPGFDSQHGLLLTLDLKGSGHNRQTGWALCKRALETARALPGVEAASLMWQLPLSGFGSAAPAAAVTAEGYVPKKNEADTVFHFNAVGPDYFRGMGIRVLSGREFKGDDDNNHSPVAVVNETLARRFWPGQDPVGRNIEVNGESRRVIGVAHDSKYLSKSEAPEAYFYVPYFQSYQPQVTLQLRTSGPPTGFESGIRQAVQQLDPTLPIVDIKPLSRQVDRSESRMQQIAALLTGAGFIGLLLAVIGVYGIISETVVRRMPAFGIRLALGAQGKDIFMLVVSQGLRLMSMGVVFGLCASALLTRLMRGILFGVSPLDPATFACMALVIGMVVLVACSIPARRAATLHPAQILRQA